MNEKQIDDLACLLGKYNNDCSLMKEVLRIWCARNLSGPTIVGLSDEQVSQFAFRYYESPIPMRVDIALTNYIKTQTFTQPEVKEVAIGLSDEQVVRLHEAICLCPPEIMPKGIIEEFLKTQTFAQPEVKEIVVGLSDRQTNDVVSLFAYDSDESLEYAEILRKYLNTQTFAQPVEFSNVELRDSYQNLIEDFEALSKELEQIKEQRFTPNWDDAPEWANWLAQDVTGQWIWFGERPTAGNVESWGWNTYQDKFFKIQVKNWKQTLQQRPTPEPVVEVGQTWNSDYGDEYDVKIIGLGKREQDWEDSICYQYVSNKTMHVTTLEYFLTKFEQVQL
jgi:hypothetical protein